MITAPQLKAIMPRADAAVWLEPLNSAMAEFGINTAKRMAMFLAQVAHESAELSRVEENLNYSASGLIRIWPKRFTSELAAIYARQPERIANKVYADRMENGPEHSGDGWRYRGRGPIQITGKLNYRECGAALKLDLIADPGMLTGPVPGARSAAWFFVYEANGIELADKGDLKTCTWRINKGLLGYEERAAYYAKALKVLGAA